METSPKHFGVTIAYVIPGFIALAGLIPFVPILGTWLQLANQGNTGFGPPIYVVLAATAAGLIVSCFRWRFLDLILGWTGIKRPAWNDSKLQENLDGFDYLVQNHYRYYEWCGNTLVASLWSYLMNRIFQTSPVLGFGTDLGMAVLLIVLFMASRDALRNYSVRTGRLLGHVAEKG